MKLQIIIITLLLTLVTFSQDFQISNSGVYSVDIPHISIDGTNAHLVYGTNFKYYKFDINGISAPIDSPIIPAENWGPNTTDIAVNPMNSNQIAIIYNDYHYDYSTKVSFYGCYLVESIDGGVNWEVPTLLDTIRLGNSLDNIIYYIPQVEYSKTGNLYALWRVHGNSTETNSLYISVNNGDAVRIDDPTSDDLELAISLTVETNSANNDLIALSYGKMHDGNVKFYFRYSQDSGQSFSDTKLVKNDGPTFITSDAQTKAFIDEPGVVKYIYSDFSHGPKLAISYDMGDSWQDLGTVETNKYVYVAIDRISSDYYIKLFLNDDNNLVFYVSHDLLNWQLGDKINTSTNSIDYAGNYISLKCDAENKFLTTAWIDNRTGNAEIFYAKVALPELVGVENENEIPKEFSLLQNYPNPFNPSTTISFTIPNQANVRLSVYNAIGEKVAELLNENVSAGNHQVTFDASNLSSGLYFYKISANNMLGSGQGFVDVKKMLLLK